MTKKCNKSFRGRVGRRGRRGKQKRRGEMEELGAEGEEVDIRGVIKGGADEGSW